jgi:hypothetical protein
MPVPFFPGEVESLTVPRSEVEAGDATSTKRLKAIRDSLAGSLDSSPGLLRVKRQIVPLPTQVGDVPIAVEN